MSKELFSEKNLKSYFVGWAAELIDPKRTMKRSKVQKAVKAGHKMYDNLKNLGVLNVGGGINYDDLNPDFQRRITDIEGKLKQ